MHIQLKKLTPSKAEVAFCGFLAVVLGLLSNTQLLLSTQGLTTAAHSLDSGAREAIASGLAWLDTYELTTTVVTFLVWALIGLLTLSIIQAFGHVLYEFDEKSRLSSNAYIHPSNFNRKKFWHAVYVTSLGSFAVAASALIYIVIFCLYLLPISSLYISAYFNEFKLADLPYTLLGFALLFVSIVGLNVCARLLRFRHEVIR